MKNKKYGFTLVELLVSVGILVLVLVAVVGVEVQALRITASGRNNIQATNLAEGALNLTKWIRDANVLNGRGDFDGMVANTGYPYKLEANGDGSWRLDQVSGSTAPAKVNLDGRDYTIEIFMENRNF